MPPEPAETAETAAVNLRIATEEAFAPPELLAAWREMLDAGSVDDPGFRSLWGFYLNSDSERATSLRARLVDLGERRLADMDAAGIDRQVLSLTAAVRLGNNSMIVADWLPHVLADDQHAGLILMEGLAQMI